MVGSPSTNTSRVLPKQPPYSRVDNTATYESSLGAENSLPSTQLTLVSHFTLTKAGRAHFFLQMRAEVTTAKLKLSLGWWKSCLYACNTRQVTEVAGQASQHSGWAMQPHLQTCQVTRKECRRNRDSCLNPSTWKAEGSFEFKVNLGYRMRPRLKNSKT